MNNIYTSAEHCFSVSVSADRANSTAGKRLLCNALISNMIHLCLSPGQRTPFYLHKPPFSKLEIAVFNPSLLWFLLVCLMTANLESCLKMKIIYKTTKCFSKILHLTSYNLIIYTHTQSDIVANRKFS